MVINFSVQLILFNIKSASTIFWVSNILAQQKSNSTNCPLINWLMWIKHLVWFALSDNIDNKFFWWSTSISIFRSRLLRELYTYFLTRLQISCYVAVDKQLFLVRLQKDQNVKLFQMIRFFDEAFEWLDGFGSISLCKTFIIIIYEKKLFCLGFH